MLIVGLLGYNAPDTSMPGVQSFTPTSFASPVFNRFTRSRTRLTPVVSSEKLRCCQAMPESSTAMPTPLPVMPVLLAKLVPLVVRTLATPVTFSSELVACVMSRFGETLCTSASAAIVLILLAGSRADNAVTEV